MTESKQPRSIDDLKKEYDRLSKRKVQAETQLEGAEQQLKELQTEAEKEFGTSNVDELTKKLEDMEAKNEKDRREYQALLDKIRSDLAEVESSAGGA